MTLCDRLTAYENGELDIEDQIDLLSDLVRSGLGMVADLLRQYQVFHDWLSDKIEDGAVLEFPGDGGSTHKQLCDYLEHLGAHPDNQETKEDS